MTCFECHTDNDDRRRYCRACGKSLVAECARCRFANQVDDRYCGGCGDCLRTELGQAPTKPARPVHLTRPAASAPARNEFITEKELRDLLQKPKEEPTPTVPPKVTQDDLDKLFGMNK